MAYIARLCNNCSRFLYFLRNGYVIELTGHEDWMSTECGRIVCSKICMNKINVLNLKSTMSDFNDIHIKLGKIKRVY